MLDMLACVVLFEIAYAFAFGSFLCFILMVLSIDEYRHGQNTALIEMVFFLMAVLIGVHCLNHIFAWIRTFAISVIANSMLVSMGILGLGWIIIRLEQQHDEEQSKKRVQN